MCGFPTQSCPSGSKRVHPSPRVLVPPRPGSRAGALPSTPSLISGFQYVRNGFTYAGGRATPGCPRSFLLSLGPGVGIMPSYRLRTILPSRSCSCNAPVHVAASKVRTFWCGRSPRSPLPIPSQGNWPIGGRPSTVHPWRTRPFAGSRLGEPLQTCVLFCPTVRSTPHHGSRASPVLLIGLLPRHWRRFVLRRSGSCPHPLSFPSSLRSTVVGTPSPPATTDALTPAGRLLRGGRRGLAAMTLPRTPAGSPYCSIGDFRIPSPTIGGVDRGPPGCHGLRPAPDMLRLSV